MIYRIYLPDLFAYRENKTKLCILTIFNLLYFFLAAEEKTGGGSGERKRDGMLVGKRFNAAYIISVWDSARQFLSARAEILLSLMKLLLAASVNQN